MAGGYSKDLRARVVSIFEEGESAREAARLLNLGVLMWLDCGRMLAIDKLRRSLGEGIAVYSGRVGADPGRHETVRGS